MSNEKLKLDVVIVGAGIVGLWCARAILRKFPHYAVAVLEGETYFGEHSSGRNSEVLHSGIYYPTGSLKHLHCLSGNLIWREYVRSKGLPFLDCGKILAAAAGQEAKLAALHAQGQRNGVQGIRFMDQEELDSLRGILHIESGLFCATSGVLSVSDSLRALRLEIEEMGGFVLSKSRARLLGFSPGDFRLDVGGSEISAAILVNAAGLFAVDFRRSLGLLDYENFYVKGNYLKLRKRIPAERLVYPIPPSDGLGLGVHITLDTAGEQKFGPDTEVVGGLDYSQDEAVLARMVPAIQQVFKTVRPEDLQLGYAGIRPKVKKDGALANDFVFQTASQHSVNGYFEFLGIESPGLTASPSLANLLVQAL